MKKHLLILAALLSFLFLFSSCTDDGESSKPDGSSESLSQSESTGESESLSSSEDTHVCVFGEWTTVTEATCETAGTRERACTCGETETETIPATGHAFTSYASNNDATCTVDGTKTAACDNGCGKTDTVADEGTATGHTAGEWVTDTDATCTNIGAKHQVCATCGETVATEAIPATGHAFTSYVSNNDATCTVDGTKTATCDNGCGETDTVADEGSATGHAFTSYASNNDATCTVDGTKTATCDNGCGETDTVADEGSATGHTAGEWVTNREATCTVDGEKHKLCATCGETVATETIPATGHVFTSYVPNGDATFDEDGTKTAVCDNGCGATDTVADEGSAETHVFTNYVSNGDATCEKDGTATAVCDNGCGTTHTKTDVGSATGHTAGAWIVDREATCTAEGEKHRTCTVCDKVIDTTAIPRANHSYTHYVSNGDATCEKDGTMTATCDNGCGATETVIDMESATGHTAGEWITDREATCTVEGEKHRVCATCGKTVATETIAIGGHSFGDAVANNNGTHTATCKNDGCGETDTLPCTGGEATCSKRAVCDVCGAAYGDTLPHTFATKNPVGKYLNTPATCTAPASYFLCCDSCGEAGDETFTYGEALGHDWGTAVPNGNGTHTATCKNDGCGKTETNACFGGETTCTAKAVCSACRGTYGDEPSHDWDDGAETTAPGCETTGTRTYACSTCSATREETLPAHGHNYNNVEIAATCLANGYTTHTCSLCGDNYTDTYVDALGHDFAGKTVTCENGRSCVREKCGMSEPALEHNYQLTETLPASCTAAMTEIYTCQNAECKKSYESSIGAPLGHDVEGEEVKYYDLVNAENCEYVNVYECKVCHTDIKSEATVERHSYKASIETEATCVTTGMKRYTCSECGDNYGETIAINDSHDWDDGVLVGEKTTYSCHGCNATKTVIDASTKPDTDLSADTLVGSGEVALKDASINLENIAGEGGAIAGKDINLAAGTLPDKERETAKQSLTEDQRKKLGDSPIYNFTITDNATNEPISDFGKGNFVTVTIEYTPAEGEDVDSIFIWFIDSEGNVTDIEATYANGYVTFQTDHFSYYTVTRLTPAERCAKYGHQEKIGATVAATCDTDGYTIVRCIRCAESWKTDVVSATGHELTTVTVPATCTETGSQTIACSKCDYSVEETYPATGHSYIMTETAATCAAVGERVFTCDCGDSYTEKIPQLAHTYTDTVVPATCGAVGYTEHKCDSCTHSYKDAYTAALAHIFVCTFSWAEDHKTATAVVTCRNACGLCEETTVEATAEELDGGCGEKARFEYTVLYVYNGETFTDVYAEEGAVKEHDFKDNWTHNEHEHWIGCRGCGIKHELAPHTWDEGTVISQPTCTKDGKISYACACGRVVTEKLEALGHDWADATCSAPATCLTCGKTEGEALGHTWIEATCTTPRSCANCDRTEGEALGHTWSEATCTAPKTCTACNETDGEALGHDTVAVVTAPTCGEDGFTTYTCKVCGDVRVGDRVAATGEHSFDGGICTVCGKEENPDCDHTELVKTVIDLSAYGMCGETATVYACACGEVVTFDNETDLGITFCDIETVKQEMTEDENGNVFVHALGVCKVCGAELVGDVQMIRFACKTTVTMVYTVTMNGETVLNNATFSISEVYHEESETVVYELHEYGACEGVLVTVGCACGENVRVENFDSACDVFRNMKEETFIDETGAEHCVMTGVCSVCGLTMRMEAYMYTEGCTTSSVETLVISIGDTEILNLSVEYEEENHDYDVTVELNGDSCLDGVVETYTCKVCGDSYTVSYSDHLLQEVEHIDLSALGMCGENAYITRLACPCGEETNIEWGTGGCWFEETHDSYVDENGVAHNVFRSHCKNCNATVTTDAYWEYGTCIDYEHATYAIEIDGNVVISKEDGFIRVGTREHHDYEYSFTLNGESCEDGYSYTATCKNCGYWYSSSGSYHDTYVMFEADGETLGCAHHAFRYEACPCGANHHTFYDSENLQYDSEKSMYFCPDCGYTVALVESIVADGCTETLLYTVAVTANGAEIFTTQSSTVSVKHDLAITATVDESGAVVLSMVCTACGEQIDDGKESYVAKLVYDENTNRYYYDFTFTPEESGRYVIESQTNDDTFVELYLVEDGGYRSLASNDDGGMNSNFKLRYSLEAGKTYAYRIRFLNNGAGEIAFTFGLDASDSGCTAHTLKNVCILPEGVTSCMNGVVRLTFCDCGYVERSSVEFGHVYTVNEYYDVSDYGGCGGFFEITSCPCGEMSNIVSKLKCRLIRTQESFVDENGITHYIDVSACKSCGLVYEKEYYTAKDGCVTTAYNRVSVVIGKTVVIEDFAYSSRSEEHAYSYEFTLYGKTCEDGFDYTATCKNCGDSYTERECYGHMEFDVEYIDLSSLGMCGDKNYVIRYSCACGENTGVNCYFYDGCEFEETFDSYIDDSGVAHNVVYMYCKNCDTRITNDSYREYEGCNFYDYSTYTVEIGGKVVADNLIMLAGWGENHRYEYSFKLYGKTCDDGFDYTRVCKDCGDSYTEEGCYGHMTFTTEHYDLSLLGMCGYSNYIQRYTCACGEYGGIDAYFYDGCEFEQTSDVCTDESGRKHEINYLYCKNCDTRITQDTYWVYGECIDEIYIAYTVEIGGNVVVDSLSGRSGSSVHHSYEYAFTLNGESCKEGYTYAAVCKTCGATEEGSGDWCRNFIVERYDLSAMGMCGEGNYIQRYTCACGQNKGVQTYFYGGCEFEETSDSYVDESGKKHDVVYMYCKNCDTRITRDRYWEYDTCHDYRYTAYTVEIGGKVVVEKLAYISSTQTHHSYVYSFTLYGKTCEDGYSYTAVCAGCNASFNGEGNTHDSLLVEAHDLSSLGMCGDKNYIHRYACPCGEYESATVNLHSGCEVEETTEAYVDENGVKHEITYAYCKVCDSKVTGDSYWECGVCSDQRYTAYTVDIGGKTVAENVLAPSSMRHHHAYEYSFTLYGESCDDGYSYTAACKNCDATTEGSRKGHSTFTLERYELSSLGMCGDNNYVYSYTCACGENTGVNCYFYDGCEFEETSDSYVDENGKKHDVVYMYCKVCDTTVTRDDYWVYGECTDERYSAYTVEIGGKTVVEKISARSGSNEHHDYEYSFKLYGESCDDGFDYTRACKNCGDGYTEEGCYGHVTFTIEQYNLSSLGMCGENNYIHRYTCPCGEHKGVSTHFYSGCTFEERSENVTDENGVSHSMYYMYCATCNTTVTRDRYWVYGECCDERITTYTVEIDGKTVLKDFAYVSSVSEHHGYIYSFTLDGESCTDGYHYTATCTRCGDVIEGSGMEHTEHAVSRYDLSSLGACGNNGELSLFSCACGERQGVNHWSFDCNGYWTWNEYIDDNGNTVSVETFCCDDCGLRYTVSQYSEKVEGECRMTVYYTVMLNIGDRLVVSEDLSCSEIYHDYETSGRLLEGATTCEDGVVIAFTCPNCGDAYENTYYHHYSYVMDRIDLDAYGSTCHGYAELSGCACGYRTSMNLDHALCEFDQKTVVNWIDGAIPTGWYYSANGEEYFSSHAYVYTCAVTDPEQCGLKIRTATYYLPSDTELCVAECYTTWQFGYNEETGECLYEITYKTGERRQYHAYVETDIAETTEDGLTVSGVRGDCPDCGGYYYNKDYTDNTHYYSRNEILAENKADNGFNRLFEHRSSYDVFNIDGWNAGYNPESYTRYVYAGGSEHWYKWENTYAPWANALSESGYLFTSVYTNSDGQRETNENGVAICNVREGSYDSTYHITLYTFHESNEYWERYEYSYQEGDICHATVIYTTSDGQNSEWTEENHYRINHVTVTPETCTQSGLNAKHCLLCDENYDFYEVEPIAHSWMKVRDDFYFCQFCGLENANGASGDIVFEDLSEEYGAGESFVVGYWNRTDVEFLYYASIILHTPLADGNDEIILDAIEFVELSDVRAIAFSISAVKEAALALGYEPDAYDVRFTLVPVGADGSFDYAITFAAEGDHDVELDRPITDDDTRVAFVDVGETVMFEITPEVNATWTFTSFSGNDSYAVLYDADKNEIAYNDNGGYDWWQFLMKHELEAGKTYYLGVRWLDTYNISGYMTVTFTCVPVEE